jgi:antitoxin component of RelBE/YafQ-DinJ toxin-antitoxin module
MKKNPGRPPKHPTTPNTTLTIKIPSTLKTQIINNANNYGMTITEYINMLIQRDQ